MMGLTMLSLEGIWTLGLRIRTAVACFKCWLMGHSSNSTENSSIKCDLMNCGRLSQEVTEENFSMMPRGHFSDTFIRKLAAFFPCPKCRPEVKVKNFGLSILAEENSKQPSIDTGV